LQEIYDQMWNQASVEFRGGEITTDPLIENSKDTRRGISLVLRPDSSALDGLSGIQERLRPIAKHQYFPSLKTLHVTLLSIISCEDHFQIDDIDALHYADVIENALARIPSFDLTFRGLCASPSCVIAQGFVDPQLIAEARSAVQEGLNRAGLRHTIGKRYPPKTAHCTVLRFKSAQISTEALLHAIDTLRDTPIGSCHVRETIFEFNDWYHEPSLVHDLRRIPFFSNAPN